MESIQKEPDSGKVAFDPSQPFSEDFELRPMGGQKGEQKEAGTPNLGLKNGLLLFLGVLFLTGSSYMLGRASRLEEARPEVVLEEYSLVSAALSPVSEVGGGGVSPEGQNSTGTQGAYVASKSGEKYHLPWCSGAKRINEENKVWFDTKEEAEAAGYTPASNCKGI